MLCQVPTEQGSQDDFKYHMDTKQDRSLPKTVQAEICLEWKQNKIYPAINQLFYMFNLSN